MNGEDLFKMLTIYKYEIPAMHSFTLKIHRYFAVYHIGVQDGKPYMWALVDTNEPIIEEEFILVGTGFEVPDNVYRCGTFILESDDFVGHVFRKMEL